MTIPDEVIERVAEALWTAEFRRATGQERRLRWTQVGTETHALWCDLARAALDALTPWLREVTDAMREEWERHNDEATPDIDWNVMWDAKLRGPGHEANDPT
jgi:hypothetical protein